MPLSKAEIKKIIKKDLGDFLKNYGYAFDIKGGGFLRRFDGGFNKIEISIVDYNPKFQISPFFLVRLNEIEQIVQKFIFVLEGYQEGTTTLNTPLSNFNGVKEYDIRNSEELKAVLNEIKSIYSTEVDSFLVKYSNIKNLNVAFNIEHSKISFMTNVDDYFRPIIAAKIADNIQFDDAADWYYKKYLEDYYLDTEEGPNKIKEVINYLKKG